MASLTVGTCAPSEWCSIPVYSSKEDRIASDLASGYTPVQGDIMFVRDKRKVSIYADDLWS